VSIGETLAAAREERGLTVQQVSDVTRLRSAIISALEHDDFDAAGGAVYARGHIRSIARVVGADGDALVAEFDAEHVAEEPSVTEVFEAETRTRRERRGPNWTAAMAAALVAAIAVLGFQVVSRSNSGSGGGNEPVAQNSTPVTPSLTPSTSQTSSSTPGETTTPSPSSSDSTLAQVPPNDVTLRMSIVGTASWVQVTNSSGAVMYTGTLTSGQTKYFRDSKSLSVVIGNAAAVDLVVNGQDLGVAGTDGQVLHETFRPGDVSGSAG
jgi:cytoskeletal protein RodZ